MKKRYHEIKEYIESFDYKLLSNEYKNNKTKLLIKCSKSHIYESRFDNFKKGNRCPHCYGNAKHSYSQVKEYIEFKGYKLLSKEYKNNKTKLKLQCSEKHIFEMNYICFKRGNRCPHCYGNAKHRYHDVKEYIESFDYKLLSYEYVNTNSKLLIKCPTGHVFKKSFKLFKSGARCAVCYYNSTSSKSEREIQEYINKMYDGKIINNDRNTIINPETNRYLELDVYLPEINKAIEFNGEYWHADSYQQIKDKIKQEQCKKMDIDLLTIYESNWLNNEEICLKVIENFLDK